MALHIKNPETHRLIHELAKKHGISPAEAIHTAVQDKLLHELCLTASPSAGASADATPNPAGHIMPHNPAVAAIDERRLQLARYDGMDAALNTMKDDVFVPALICLLALLVTPFLGDTNGAIVLLVTVAGAGLLFSYSRSLAHEKASRDAWRLTVAREMRVLSASLPDELMFLSWIPEPRTGPAPSPSPSTPVSQAASNSPR